MARLHHVNLQELMTVHSRADTLGVINLYVSRVRSSMSWIKTPADVIGRHAVYDCNSLVCAVGRWVAAGGGVILVRERSALADPYCQSTWMYVCLCVHNFEVKYLGNERR